MKKCKPIMLTIDELALLIKITDKTKTDCWLDIISDNDRYYAYDLENGKFISWKTVFKELSDALLINSFTSDNGFYTCWKQLKKYWKPLGLTENDLFNFIQLLINNAIY